MIFPNGVKHTNGPEHQHKEFKYGYLAKLGDNTMHFFVVMPKYSNSNSASATASTSGRQGSSVERVFILSGVKEQNNAYYSEATAI